MVASTASSQNAALIDQLVQVCKEWIREDIIDGHDVDTVNALVLLCGLAPEYSGLADHACLNYEMQEAAKAFLAKDFHECERHVTEAHAWKNSMDQELAAERAKRHKTSVK